MPLLLALLGCDPHGELPMATNAAACSVRYDSRTRIAFCPTANPQRAHALACELAEGSTDRMFYLDIECQMPGVAPAEMSNMLFGGYFTQITSMFRDEVVTPIGATRACAENVMVEDLEGAVLQLTADPSRGALSSGLAAQRADSLRRATEAVQRMKRRADAQPRRFTCNGKAPRVRDRLQLISFRTPRPRWPPLDAEVELILSSWQEQQADASEANATYYQVFQPLPEQVSFPFEYSSQLIPQNYGAIELKPECSTFQDASRCTTMDYVWALGGPVQVFIPAQANDLAVDFASRAMRLAGELSLCDALGDDPALRAALQPRGLVGISVTTPRQANYLTTQPHPCDLHRASD